MNALEKMGQQVLGQVGQRFGRVALATFHSIRDGSAATGAPGQPVGRGDLKESFLLVHDSPTSAVISSDSDHAVPIEEGINRWGPVEFTHGGGPHSLALTVANWDRVVEQEFPSGWAGR